MIVSSMIDSWCYLLPQSFLFHDNSFEKKYDPIPVLNWMRDHPIVPIFGVILYGILICLGQYFLKDQDSWKWRNSLAVWNLFLSVFSTIGMLRTAPQLLHNLTTLSLRDNLCTDPRITYGSGSTGLWVQLFILSKFPWVQKCIAMNWTTKDVVCFHLYFLFLTYHLTTPWSELFDTFFILIHKKPLIFLHWYHHITVLLYCWHSYVTTSPPGIFFVVMNYSVHASA